MAARVLAAALLELDISLDDVRLSRETLRRNRANQRESQAHKMKDIFKYRLSRILSVHWDGKQMPSVENKFEKIDRIPILVASQDWNQLLGVPRLERGTGQLQANAVHNCLKEWDVIDDVRAMVFDTTASNTGPISGTCTLLEEFIGRDLLHLAWRHHILELLLKAAFESAMESTSGPDVAIFKRFQESWKTINKEKFSPGVDDVQGQEALHRNISDNIAFCEIHLKVSR